MAFEEEMSRQVVSKKKASREVTRKVLSCYSIYSLALWL